MSRQALVLVFLAVLAVASIVVAAVAIQQSQTTARMNQVLDALSNGMTQTTTGQTAFAGTQRYAMTNIAGILTATVSAVYAKANTEYAKMGISDADLAKTRVLYKSSQTANAATYLATLRTPSP